MAGYGMSLYVATAVATSSSVEGSFDRAGLDVRRSASGPLDPVAEGHAAVLTLVAPPPLLDAERSALRSFVEDGGTLYLITLHPEHALWPGLAGAIKVLPGPIHGADGSTPAFEVAGAPARFARDGLHAILVDGVPASASVRSEPSAIRDTDGDSVLETGEPAGPFDVAVSASAGRGHVLIVAADPLAQGAETFPYATLVADARGLVVVSDGRVPGAWSAPARTTLALLASVPSNPWMDALLAATLVAVPLALTSTKVGPPPRSDRPAELVRALRETLDASPLPAAHPFRRSMEKNE